MSNQPNSQKFSAKTWQIVLWPAHTTVNNLMYVLLMFVSYVAVGGYGIAVATAGLISTYTRIFDGITDPIIAMITDRLNTKYGKVRILMIIGQSIQLGSVLILFIFGIGRGIVFYTVFYIIYYIGSTFASVTTNTGNAILTKDPKQRPMIFRWAMVYTTLISSFSSLYLSGFLFRKYGGVTIEALRELCLTLVGISVVLCIFAFIAISEKDKPENFPQKAGGGNINAKDAWAVLKKNKALKALIFAGASDKLAHQAAGQSAVNVLIYGIIIGNFSFYGTFNMINVIPTLLALFYATKQASKHGTKSALVRWTIISLVFAVVSVLYMAVIDTTQISVATIPTAIFIILSVGYSAAMKCTSTCTNAAIPDIIDYELYRSGNYMPGTVSSLYAFVDKVISSFGATIVGYGLAAIGYISVQPQPTDTLTAGVFWMGMFLWMGLPILGFVTTLIAMKFYPLDREMMVTVQEHNRNISFAKSKVENSKEEASKEELSKE